VPWFQSIDLQRFAHLTSTKTGKSCRFDGDKSAGHGQGGSQKEVIETGMKQGSGLLLA
jgi:hypothetical protein